MPTLPLIASLVKGRCRISGGGIKSPWSIDYPPLARGTKYKFRFSEAAQRIFLFALHFAVFAATKISTRVSGGSFFAL
jgi:hypothetical protein